MGLGEGSVNQEYLFPICGTGGHALTYSQPPPLLLASLEPSSTSDGGALEII